MRVVIFSLLLVLLAPTMAAHASSIDDCDRLASFDLDPKRRAEPVPSFKIKFDEAIAACESASGEHPKEGRIWLQLGRAYERKAWETTDQPLYKRAEQSYERAAQLKYAVAYLSLGDLYATADVAFASPKKSFESYEAGSRLGDPSSSASLAEMYAFFTYPAQDCAKAWRLFQSAAQTPTRIVYSYLGLLHRDGVCASEVPAAKFDLNLAKTYFRQATDFGDRAAANNLAALLEEARGASAAAEAMKLYLLAADLGNGLAARNIGQLYQTGGGVKQSDEEAVKWYRQGATLRNTSAMRGLAFMLRTGRLGAVENLPNVAEADTWDKRARELAQRRADLGNQFEMNQLAIMMWEGIGGQKDTVGALRYAEMAADRGVLYAINYLGFMYEKTGRYADAVNQYKRGEKLGMALAKANLGKALYFGRGTDKDVARGKALLESVGNEEASAAWGLADIYIGEQDYIQARAHFDKAIRLGSTGAMIELARLLYQNLEGTEPPLWPGFLNGRQRAMELFRQASALGIITARRDMAGAELEILERESPSDYCAQLELRIVPELDASTKLGDVIAHDQLLELIRAGRCPIGDEVRYRRIAAALIAGASSAPDMLVDMCVTKRSAACEPTAAIGLLKQASTQRRFDAQFALAKLLETGRLTAQDLSESGRLLSEIESSGQPAIQLRLAWAWIIGTNGLNAQPDRGVALLRKMTKDGSPSAALSLGRHLLNTKNQASIEEAIVVLETLARNIEYAADARDLIASRFYWNWRQIAPVSRDSFVTWASQDLANVNRARGLGRVYLKHGDTAAIKAEGFRLIEGVARDHSDVEAMLEAGWALDEGNGTEKNGNRAQEFFDRAASLKSSLGITNAAFDCFPARTSGRRCQFAPSDYAAMLKKLVRNNYADEIIYVIFANWLLQPTVFSSEEELADLIAKLVIDASPANLTSLGLVQQTNPQAQPSSSMVRALQRKFREAKLYVGADDGRMPTLVRGLQLRTSP